MEPTALHYLILGAVQGIFEWLPISSSGVLALILTNYFQITDVEVLLSRILLLHLGTFFAALIYFRKEVAEIFKTIYNYKKSPDYELVLVNFLFVSTVITGIIGVIILTIISVSDNLEFTGKIITLFIGFLLLLTGLIQIKSKNIGLRKESSLNNKDSILLGFVQGLSTLPGLSRSGITVSTLLLRKFNDTTALKLSFLMSLPVVLLGNIILNYKEFLNFSNEIFYGVLASFVFGILTIHGLMQFSRKVNFGWFVIVFGAVMMISVLI